MERELCEGGIRLVKNGEEVDGWSEKGVKVVSSSEGDECERGKSQHLTAVVDVL